MCTDRSEGGAAVGVANRRTLGNQAFVSSKIDESSLQAQSGQADRQLFPKVNPPTICIRKLVLLLALCPLFAPHVRNNVTLNEEPCER